MDTNVLVSAFTARGLCADLIVVILADHVLIIVEFVLNELDRALKTKLKIPEKDVLEILKFLNGFHIEPLPDNLSKVKIDEDDDRWCWIRQSGQMPICWLQVIKTDWKYEAK